MGKRLGADVIVVGGGLIGSAAAYGLSRRGIRTLLLDGADTDVRAARANFGLVWVQGKGPDMPAYQRLTRMSSDMWPAFAEELSETSDVALDYYRDGGLTFALNEEEFEHRAAFLRKMAGQFGEDEYDTTMLRRRDLERLIPGTPLGKDVVGASYCWRDGHLNPLTLLRALQEGMLRAGGHFLRGESVRSIRAADGEYECFTSRNRYCAQRLLIAAGNRSPELARQVGLNVVVRPQRGQLLITERMPPLLTLPATGVRQTAEGTFIIGGTQEDTGFDTSTRVRDAAAMADRAVRTIPALGSAMMVRHWAGLRVMTPDSYPIYEESEDCPGAFVALCHSGATLAAMHADRLATTLETGRLPDDLASFSQRRFDVQAA